MWSLQSKSRKLKTEKQKKNQQQFFHLSTTLVYQIRLIKLKITLTHMFKIIIFAHTVNIYTFHLICFIAIFLIFSYSLLS